MLTSTCIAAKELLTAGSKASTAIARSMLVLSVAGSRTARDSPEIDDMPTDRVTIATLTNAISCNEQSLIVSSTRHTDTSVTYEIICKEGKRKYNRHDAKEYNNSKK